MKDVIQTSECLTLLLLLTVLPSIHVTGNTNLPAKKRAYESRIWEVEPRVEHSSFTPLVLSATGEWIMKPMCFTNGWLLYYLTNRRSVCRNTWMINKVQAFLLFVTLNNSMYQRSKIITWPLHQKSHGFGSIGTEFSVSNCIVLFSVHAHLPTWIN